MTNYKLVKQELSQVTVAQINWAVSCATLKIPKVNYKLSKFLLIF